MGSRFACRRGSRGASREPAAPGRDFGLSRVSRSSKRLLTDPGGRYFIGNRALLLESDERYFSLFFLQVINPFSHVP